MGSTELDQEYATQFFQFTPKSLIDEVYNAVTEYTYTTLEGLQTWLKTEFSDVVTQEQTEGAAKTIIPKLNRATDKAFDKFEVYLLKNILRVPNYVLLPEDEAQRHSCSPEEASLVSKEIHQLQEKIRNLTYINAAMRQELEMLDEVIPQYEAFTGQMENLKKFGSGLDDLRESHIFLSEKSKKIIETLEKTHVKGLYPNE